MTKNGSILSFFSAAKREVSTPQSVSQDARASAAYESTGQSIDQPKSRNDEKSSGSADVESVAVNETADPGFNVSDLNSDSDKAVELKALRETAEILRVSPCDTYGDLLLSLIGEQHSLKEAIAQFFQDLEGAPFDESLEPTHAFAKSPFRHNWALHCPKIQNIWQRFCERMRKYSGQVAIEQMAAPSGPLAAKAVFLWHYPTTTSRNSRYSHVMDPGSPTVVMQAKKIGYPRDALTIDLIPLRLVYSKVKGSGAPNWPSFYKDWDRIEPLCADLCRDLTICSPIVVTMGAHAWHAYKDVVRQHRRTFIKVNLSLDFTLFGDKVGIGAVLDSDGVLCQLVFPSYHGQYALYNRDQQKGALWDLIYNAACGFARIPLHGPNYFTLRSSTKTALSELRDHLGRPSASTGNKAGSGSVPSSSAPLVGQSATSNEPSRPSRDKGKGKAKAVTPPLIDLAVGSEEPSGPSRDKGKGKAKAVTPPPEDVIDLTRDDDDHPSVIDLTFDDVFPSLAGPSTAQPIPAIDSDVEEPDATLGVESDAQDGEDSVSEEDIEFQDAVLEDILRAEGEADEQLPPSTVSWLFQDNYEPMPRAQWVGTGYMADRYAKHVGAAKRESTRRENRERKRAAEGPVETAPKPKKYTSAKMQNWLESEGAAQMQAKGHETKHSNLIAKYNALLNTHQARSALARRHDPMKSESVSITLERLDNMEIAVKRGPEMVPGKKKTFNQHLSGLLSQYVTYYKKDIYTRGLRYLPEHGPDPCPPDQDHPAVQISDRGFRNTMSRAHLK